jgi:tol-pal system protein YbgF
MRWWSERGAVTPALLFLALMLMASVARAALFDDDEARKRIDLLRQRVDQMDQRLTSVEGTVKSQGLVDLLKDIEQIKADIAKLRGQQEVMTYELEQAQKRQRDLYIDLDGRLRKLETTTGGAPAPGAPAPGAPTGQDTGAAPPPVAGPASPPLPGTAARGPATAADLAGEQRAYDSALDLFKGGSYPAAITAFQSFVRSYPRSPLAASALYWAGNAQFAQRDYKGAIATQRQLLSTYPDSQKIPDALLNIASSQSELGDRAGARRTLEDIVSRYPSSDAAAKAKQRLAAR